MMENITSRHLSHLQHSQNHDYVIFTREIDFTVNAIYFVLVTSAVFLNGSVLFVLLRRSAAAQQQQNLYKQGFKTHMAHACVAHTMAVLGIVPYVVVDQQRIRFGNWVEETLQCGLVEGILFFLIPAIVHGFVFCSLGLCRYRAIRYPLDWLTNTRFSKWRLTSCWTVGLVLGLPNAMTWRHEAATGRCLRISCSVGMVYQILLCVFGLFLPLLSVIVLTVLTVNGFSTKSASVYNESNNNSNIPSNVNIAKERYRTRTSRLMLTLMAMHLVCWLPIGVYFFLSSIGFFANTSSGDRKKVRIVRLALLPCVIECATAPVAYFFNKDKARREFLDALVHCFRKICRFKKNKVSPINN